MKIVSTLSILILLCSCGKYERPFISFQSPEKRLMDKEWNCTKVVSEEGEEFEINDRIEFTIDGVDSVFTRITDYWPLNPLYYTLAPNPVVSDTIVGTWTWGFALEGNMNKQILIIDYPDYGFRRINRVNILTKKELVFRDQSLNNAEYHYESP